MRKILIMLSLFAALGVNAVNAGTNSDNPRDQIIRRTDEAGTFRDGNGEYHWQVIERRVYIPSYQTRGLFGIGWRTVPAHYELRTDRIKVYNYRNSQPYRDNRGWQGRHPHGMPPGQRKKLDRYRDNYRGDNYRDDYDRDRKYEHRKNKHGHHDRDDD